MAFMARMKARWGVGVWGVIAILTAFSLAGMTVVRLREPVLGFVLPPDAPTWVWWVTYLAIIFPLYQVCLLSYGTLLGQFGFFWKKEKAMVRFLFGWTRRVFPVVLFGAVGMGGLLAGSGVDAEAKVVQTTPTGFTIEQQLALPVSPETAYDVMTGDISGWWDHSFSESPAKFHIDPRPGGAFVEIFDESGDGVLHATVNVAHRGKTLRFTGPLGLSGTAITLVTTWSYAAVAAPAAAPEMTDSGEVDAAGGAVACVLKLTVDASGNIKEGWPETVDKVWTHFLVEQLKPYIESGKYLEQP